jgi:hypothetical protein
MRGSDATADALKPGSGLRLRRVSYSQILCITVWTGAISMSKAAMAAMTCVNVLDVSPDAAKTGGPFQRATDGSTVAVTLLRPPFLLRYRAASATLSSRSGIFFSAAGTRSSPHRPKLAVTSIFF